MLTPKNAELLNKKLIYLYKSLRKNKIEHLKQLAKGKHVINFKDQDYFAEFLEGHFRCDDEFGHSE